MLNIIQETLIDTLKIIPFLFVAFLLIEYFEHKTIKKNRLIIKKAGRFGPFIGSILGFFPQCGFSVVATNLYATRIITIGTLLSIYLSTSDEMLPILLAKNVDIKIIIKILVIKILIAMIVGFIIDYLFRKRNINCNDKISELCQEEHCNCNHGLLKSSIRHTISMTLFLILISFILNTVFYYFNEDILNKIFLKGKLFGPLISSLLGLIPNCASSVVITELYINNIITFGSMIAGLLTGSGIALLILFRTNKDFKDNITILLTIYFVGILSGILLNFIEFSV